MNIDYDFLKFALKQMIVPAFIICSFLLHYILPKPWNLVVMFILICYFIKEICSVTYTLLRFRYESYLKEKEKIWNALKETK